MKCAPFKTADEEVYWQFPSFSSTLQAAAQASLGQLHLRQELEAARGSMREQLLVASAETEEQKAQLAGLLRTGGLYGYGH